MIPFIYVISLCILFLQIQALSFDMNEDEEDEELEKSSAEEEAAEESSADEKPPTDDKSWRDKEEPVCSSQYLPVD